ncbi:holo-ACP synthase [Humibacter antri]
MRIGIDAQPVDEVRDALIAHGERYLRRIFTEHEIECCGGVFADPATSAASLAARYAAKEAVFKVLRVSDTVPPFTDIEVVREPGGWTSLRLLGTARTLAEDAGLVTFEISLTHTDRLAIAVVAAT